MADFGNFCLLFALCLSLYALFSALIGASQKRPRIIRSSERAVYAAAGCASLSLFTLLYLLFINDFSISHVADSSSRDLPLFYKVAAIWGAHDGSMLLWVFFTSILSALVVYQNKARLRDMMPYVTAVLMVDLCFFLCLNLFISNPFKKLTQVFADGSAQTFLPADGKGLNPLLQYWAMVIHPPILYVGFIGFLVPFAFAIAALASKRLGNTWIRTTRRWTLLTWLFLGAGILLGGKWAYVVLGWGGYWGWDPVENASLMPWLMGTAFLHSVIIQEKRGMLKVWNILLIALTYLLGIFGTFVTRSGVVSSVHAFSNSGLGVFFILYMGIVLGASLYLIVDRGPFLKTERKLDSYLSRESAFFFNNVVLVAACFAVFWGTMFPVFSEWLRGVKIVMGPPFFNRVNIPIGLILLFLTGVGPLFAWRKTSRESLKRAFYLPGVVAAIACAALLLGGMRSFYTIVCLTLCVFVVAAIIEEFYKGASIRHKTAGENYFKAFVSLTLKNKRRYGGYIVHFSIVLIFIGLSGAAFNIQTVQQLSSGEKLKIGNYSLKMDELRRGETANYQYEQVVLQAYKDGRYADTLVPERRIYKTSEQQSTTTVALRSTPKEDLYVVISGMTNDGSKCEITAHVNPLVFWIWIGAALMVVGTIITMLPDGRGQAGETPALQEE
jgi:cytochrome c-type biogenesis protein CcmF